MNTHGPRSRAHPKNEGEHRTPGDDQTKRDVLKVVVHNALKGGCGGEKVNFNQRITRSVSKSQEQVAGGRVDEDRAVHGVTRADREVGRGRGGFDRSGSCNNNKLFLTNLGAIESLGGGRLSFLGSRFLLVKVFFGPGVEGTSSSVNRSNQMKQMKCREWEKGKRVEER